MRLTVVSHTPHYGDPSAPAGWGPTVRELDEVSRLFDEVIHVAPLHPGDPPASALSYRGRVKLRSVAAAGGAGARNKLRVALQAREYRQAVKEAISASSVVHVRCPANISAIALADLAARRVRPPVWFKYAGSWTGRPGEALSYRVQRAALARWPWPGTVTTINGADPRHSSHVVSMLNPSLSDDELLQAASAARDKRLTKPLGLLWVGALTGKKRPLDALDVLAAVRRQVPAHLDLVGDGPSFAEVRAGIEARGLGGSVSLHGWRSRQELNPLYSRAHVNLLTSETEGWPKVLGEGMAFGAVPVATDVGSVRHYLQSMDVGAVRSVGDIQGLADAVLELVDDSSTWTEQSRRSSACAHRFSYAHYLRTIAELLRGLGVSVHEP